MKTDNNPRKGWRSWTIEIKVWKILAVLIILPILTFWMMVVHQEDEIIALTRNEVVTDPAGNRVWHGTFFNTDDIPYRDLGVTVNFLDRNGETVGKAEAETAALPPSTGLDLQADLPPEAVNLRIYSVRWRNDRTATMFGPFRNAWEFGYLMYDPQE
jgi:hypothetical protein